MSSTHPTPSTQTSDIRPGTFPASDAHAAEPPGVAVPLPEPPSPSANAEQRVSDPPFEIAVKPYQGRHSYPPTTWLYLKGATNLGFNHGNPHTLRMAECLHPVTNLQELIDALGKIWRLALDMDGSEITKRERLRSIERVLALAVSLNQRGRLLAPHNPPLLGTRPEANPSAVPADCRPKPPKSRGRPVPAPATPEDAGAVRSDGADLLRHTRDPETPEATPPDGSTTASDGRQVPDSVPRAGHILESTPAPQMAPADPAGIGQQTPRESHGSPSPQIITPDGGKSYDPDVFEGSSARKREPVLRAVFFDQQWVPVQSVLRSGARFMRLDWLKPTDGGYVSFRPNILRGLFDLESSTGTQVGLCLVPELGGCRASTDGVGLVTALQRLAHHEGDDARMTEEKLYDLLDQAPAGQLDAIGKQIDEALDQADHLENAVRFSPLERFVRHLIMRYGPKRRYFFPFGSWGWTIGRLIRRADRKGRPHSTDSRAHDAAIVARLRRLDA